MESALNVIKTDLLDEKIKKIIPEIVSEKELIKFKGISKNERGTHNESEHHR